MANDRPYRSNGKLSPWLKIKNPMYSQAEGRGELFKPRAGPVRFARRAHNYPVCPDTDAS
jgi:hypothetical protein